MSLEKCVVVFYVLSFPPSVYVETLKLIASIPGPSILTLQYALEVSFDEYNCSQVICGGSRYLFFVLPLL